MLVANATLSCLDQYLSGSQQVSPAHHFWRPAASQVSVHE